MTTSAFLKKVAYLRQLQKRYFLLRRENKPNDAASCLRECKAVESQVDEELPAQISKSETPKLF